MYCYYLYSCFFFFSSILPLSMALLSCGTSWMGFLLKYVELFFLRACQKWAQISLKWIVLLLTQPKAHLIMAVIECVVMMMMQILLGKKMGDVLTYWLCYLLQFGVQCSSGECAAVWDMPAGIDTMAWKCELLTVLLLTFSAKYFPLGGLSALL